MSGSLRVGRVAGVPVALNWSVVVIFVLIAAGLAAGNFPAAYPGDPAWAYAVAGLAAAIVFLAGLLAHEVSHAIVASRNGLRVERITLWMLGGVAEIRGEARNPGMEVRIAGIGPLVSLLQGVAFAAVAAGIWLAGGTGLVRGVFAWLALINVALAVFNVLPAAPLDGGRLLRAVLWKRFGDRTRAAIAAARAGRVLGAALIALGLLALLLRGTIGGLWFLLLGWFMLAAASAEERQTRTVAALSGIRVGDIMSTRPQTVPPGMSVADFVDHHIMNSRHTTFPLTDDGSPVGLVTLDRVRQVPRERRGDTSLREVACPADQLTLTTPGERVNELLPRLNGCSDGRALVVEEDHLVGIVSPSDINRAMEHQTLRRDGGLGAEGIGAEGAVIGQQERPRGR
ncbi:site-2 protease family protein [Phytohabitans suffuscus]|uniref:Zinc metalloprotease n=1 Tax=Phytohabitans suffuscus TaxID=624315 RepID=A0A6F8Z0X0_9ACTN|nr:site-2 protease family protein [Phytohabitans suffuscus]BCB91893.1 putative zinc metalloprotease Rip3 [Phytohabitans suffuscus]